MDRVLNPIVIDPLVLGTIKASGASGIVFQNSSGNTIFTAGAGPGTATAFAAISASGQITSTVSTGTAPLVIASTTAVANLNASLLLGQTWANPGAIGGTTPAAVSCTTLTTSGNVTINSNELRITSSAPQYWFTETDGAADEKKVLTLMNAGVFRLRMLNDAESVANDIFSVTRSGATPVLMTVPVAASFTGGLTTTTSVVTSTATSAGTTNGAIQLESNQGKHYAYTNGIGGWLDKCIFSQYAAVTHSGAVTAQSLASATARGTRTLPANFFKRGKVLKYRLCGVYTTDVAAGNATVLIKIGSTTIRTTGSFALDASITNGYWVIDGEFTCLTTGATGTVTGQTVWMHKQSVAGGDALHAQEMTTSGAVTLDTTASGAFDVEWTADDAGTSITCTCFRLWEVC